MQERLQKLIARAGVASRRRAEELISTGQVEVNGKVVTALGAKADPERDAIRVGGSRLRFPARGLHVALNKPDACVSTLHDPAGRKTLRDCLQGVAGRVFPVGGLEYHATGLVLLTSDGEFAARLARALERGLSQTYQVKLDRRLTPEEMAAVAGRVGPLRSSREGRHPWYEVRLTGGGKERLRGILRKWGLHLEKLRREAIGRVQLGELAPGRWRALAEDETRALEAAVKLAGTERDPTRARNARRRGSPRASGRQRAARGKSQGEGRE